MTRGVTPRHLLSRVLSGTGGLKNRSFSSGFTKNCGHPRSAALPGGFHAQGRTRAPPLPGASSFPPGSPSPTQISSSSTRVSLAPSGHKSPLLSICCQVHPTGPPVELCLPSSSWSPCHRPDQCPRPVDMCRDRRLSRVSSFEGVGKVTRANC